MKITAPTGNQSFTIGSNADWPSLRFVTDGSGPHAWQWTLAWGTYTKSGQASTPGNTWDATSAVTGMGGRLSVKVTAGGTTSSVVVTIKGTNPAASDVTAFLATKSGSDGFGMILSQESKYRHFNSHGEPIKSFDNGYGMCQLTTPAPSFQQVWNWKSNVEGGLALFATKRAAAVAYLSQSGRSYTADQLKYEAVCRWNGGSYHDWNATTGKWERRSTILCDTATGNIGWDMTKPDNAGKTEAELHTRDSGAFSAPPTSDANWRYSGICYADHVLG